MQSPRWTASLLAPMAAVALAGTAVTEPARKADELGLAEAFQGGLVRITFTGLDQGERLELVVERRVGIPMLLTLPKGVTTFGTGDQARGIATEHVTRLDLSRTTQVKSVFRQSGAHRITQGRESREACFNGTTGLLLRLMKSGKAALLDAVIAQLQEPEAVRRRLGATALGAARDPRALPFLEKQAAEDADAEARAAAKEAIARIKGGP